MEENKLHQLKKIERNEDGLINGLEYIFDINGKIDWKAMTPKGYLYLNPDKGKRDRIEKEYGKPYEQIDPIKDNVKDSDLIIKLAGLRALLQIRGFNYIKLLPIESRVDYASVNCEISFIPSFESELRTIICQDNACAHEWNTNNFAKNYLLEIASNRALCRCIRNYLNLAIVSSEELGGTTNEQEQPKAAINSEKQIKMLNTIMIAKNVKWKNIEVKLKEENRWKDEYTCIDSLPKDLIFEFIERLKKMPSPT